MHGGSLEIREGVCIPIVVLGNAITYDKLVFTACT